ncbi:uncharacterized protein V1516DRAFT_671811 [Lipomyces oligophaga]|uniref:uncharacterized protein n=1 Tax=Lipomyces oligophaga TaxID=45792 RepID=UPI0034CF993F
MYSRNGVHLILRRSLSLRSVGLADTLNYRQFTVGSVSREPLTAQGSKHQHHDSSVESAVSASSLSGDQTPLDSSKIVFKPSSSDDFVLEDFLQLKTNSAGLVDPSSNFKALGHSSFELLSLVNALLSNGDLDRVHAMLPHLFEISKPETSASIRDEFLARLIDTEIKNTATVSRSVTWLTDMLNQYPDLPCNGKPFALLLSSISSLQDYKLYDRLVVSLHKLWTRHDIPTEEILQNSTLSYTDVRQIVNKCYIPESQVPERFRLGSPFADSSPSGAKLNAISADNEALRNYVEAEQTEEAKNLLEHLPDPIAKPGYEALDPVEAYGLKLLRVSLQGIAEGKRPDDLLTRLTQDFDLSTSDITDYLTLESAIKKLDPALRDEYERALERYNMQRQRALETLALDSSYARWQYDYESMIQRGDIYVKNLNEYLWSWHSLMMPLVKEELRGISNLLKNNKIQIADNIPIKNQRLMYGPYMLLLDPKKLCTITIFQLIRFVSSIGHKDGVPTSTVLAQIGNAVESEYFTEQLLRKDITNGAPVSLKQLQNQRPSDVRRMLKYQRDRLSKEDSKVDDSAGNQAFMSDWPPTVKIALASSLVSIFMNVAKITVTMTDPVTKEDVSAVSPVLTHTYQLFKGNRIGLLRFHPDFVRKVGVDRSKQVTVQPKHLPMLVAPKPWTDQANGGYYYTQVSIMRTKGSLEQTLYIKEASRRNILGYVYEGLNVLGRTAWTINSRLFKVITKVWNSGDEFIEIPGKSNVSLKLPEEPARDSDPALHRDWQRACKQMIHDAQRNHSIRCDLNYKLEIARAFIGERFYFPHNMDFRGRAYAIPPYLNHLGNDLCRSLLMFWDAKPLGAKGLRWMKIHLANLCGYDKSDFEARVQFTEDHLEDIFDSADNPLEGSRFWMQASDPWQALAVCMDLADALRSPNPEAHLSRIPVHQDGTCNGLQHYAALGGDEEGASQVNLAPSETPADIYTYVSNAVRELAAKEAENGNELAAVARDIVARKVIKQTVMTNVYGVTFVGARQQIHNRLKEIDGLDPVILWSLSAYLTNSVFKVVRNMFTGAHLIQDWLGECAKRISKSLPPPSKTGQKDDLCRTSVVWTTPLGMPVVQPYRSTGYKVITTNLQNVSIMDPSELRRVDSRKQASAFPPNFIHSLDATHMLLSAYACGKNNMSFASVHDSYWTHACDIDKMNAILRDAFVKLHSGDLIQKLKEEFESRYDGYLYPIQINRTSKESVAINEWRRQWKKSHGKLPTDSEVIALEHKRQAYLASKDPQIVMEGMQIITPLSIIGDTKLETLLPPFVQKKKSSPNSAYKSKENITEDDDPDKVVRGVLGIQDGDESATNAHAAEMLNQSIEDDDVDTGLASDRFNSGSSDSSSSDISSGESEESGQEDLDSDPHSASKVKLVRSLGTRVLIPLRFPDVPPKGNFNVDSLKSSLYFFS